MKRPADLPEVTPGSSSILLAAVPVLLVVLTVLWVGFWVLTRRPDLVVRDSPRFVDALTIWHPLIFARSSTPRSVKRFMNRVRYLAMRQRRQTEAVPSWRRLLRRLFPEPEAAQAAQADAPPPIPDELLVALAAIQHFKPRWLMGNKELVIKGSLQEMTVIGSLKELREVWGLDIAEAEKTAWTLFQEVKQKHSEKFGGWYEERLVPARDEFLRISEGIQVN